MNIYEMWGKLVPDFEEPFRQSIIKKYANWGGGKEEKRENLGKTYSNAYEIYIYAFFLGLYSGKRTPLKNEKVNFSHAIENWGNFERRDNRKPYPNLRKYIYSALIATTDLDFISLDKGDITPEEIVKELKKTMEEYANTGFHLINQKQSEIEDYFYKNTGFLDYILEFVISKNEEDEEPESLD